MPGDNKIRWSHTSIGSHTSIRCGPLRLDAASMALTVVLNQGHCEWETQQLTMLFLHPSTPELVCRLQTLLVMCFDVCLTSAF